VDQVPISRAVVDGAQLLGQESSKQILSASKYLKEVGVEFLLHPLEVLCAERKNFDVTKGLHRKLPCHGIWKPKNILNSNSHV